MPEQLNQTGQARSLATNFKENNMQRNIFTTRSARQARRAVFDFIGAVLLTGAGVIMLLAYFDVLTH